MVSGLLTFDTQLSFILEVKYYLDMYFAQMCDPMWGTMVSMCCLCSSLLFSAYDYSSESCHNWCLPNHTSHYGFLKTNITGV